MSFPGSATTAGTVSVPATTKLQPASAVSLEAWLQFSKTPATYTFALGYGSDSYYAPYGFFFRTNGQILAQFFTTRRRAGSRLDDPSLGEHALLRRRNLRRHDRAPLHQRRSKRHRDAIGHLQELRSRVRLHHRRRCRAQRSGFQRNDRRSRRVRRKGVDGDPSSESLRRRNDRAGSDAVAFTKPDATPSSATDWDTFGFDLQRSGYNPNETIVSPSNVGSLQQVWAYNVGSTMVHEPVYAYGVNVGGQPTNIIYAGSSYGSTHVCDQREHRCDRVVRSRSFVELQVW